MKEITTAIAKVMGTVGYVQKKGENKFHGYKFAAIGDILAKIQPAMAEAGLVITQSEIGHEIIDNGTVMTATYEFAMAHVSGEIWDDKPRHTGMAGARNSKGGFDDKSLNKCHTAARKYFLMGLFQIPTGDVADPDEDDAPAPLDRPKQSATVTTITPSRASNGNGNHAEPAKRPVAGKPEEEAKKYVARAEGELEGFTRIDDLRKWDDKNRDWLTRLHAIDQDLHANLTEVIAHTYRRLNTLGVG